MRKPIDPTSHVAIDYGFTAALFAAPSLLGFNATARKVSYTLGAAISGVNMLTRNRLGLAPVISIKTHGQLETPYVPMVLMLPAMSGALRNPKARAFFLGFFGIALANYLLTDYEAEEEGRATPSEPYAYEQLEAVTAHCE